MERITVTNTTAHDSGSANEPSQPAADLSEGVGNVAKLICAAVAALPARDEENVGFPVKKWPRKSSEQGVKV